MEENQQKISVILPTSELDRFNSYCANRGYKKSTLIRRLIREHLEREGFPPADHVDTASTAASDANARQRGRSRKKAS